MRTETCYPHIFLWSAAALRLQWPWSAPALFGLGLSNQSSMCSGAAVCWSFPLPQDQPQVSQCLLQCSCQCPVWGCGTQGVMEWSSLSRADSMLEDWKLRALMPIQASVIWASSSALGPEIPCIRVLGKCIFKASFSVMNRLIPGKCSSESLIVSWTPTAFTFLYCCWQFLREWSLIGLLECICYSWDVYLFFNSFQDRCWYSQIYLCFPEDMLS